MGSIADEERLGAWLGTVARRHASTQRRDLADTDRAPHSVRNDLAEANQACEPYQPALDRRLQRREA